MLIFYCYMRKYSIVIQVFVVCILIVFLIISIVSIYRTDNRSCNLCRETQNMSIAARVDSIYNELRLPGIIAMSDGQCIYESFLSPPLSKMVIPGDSIFKPQGLFRYYVYKNANKDSCVVYDANYDCDFECHDCANYENIKKMEIKSRVRKAVYSQHRFLIVLEENGYQLYNNYTGHSLRNIVRTGDSIYKPSGELKYYIYKKCNSDSCIVVEGDCGCDD